MEKNDNKHQPCRLYLSYDIFTFLSLLHKKLAELICHNEFLCNFVVGEHSERYL